MYFEGCRNDVRADVKEGYSTGYAHMQDHWKVTQRRDGVTRCIVSKG